MMLWASDADISVLMSALVERCSGLPWSEGEMILLVWLDCVWACAPSAILLSDDFTVNKKTPMWQLQKQQITGKFCQAVQWSAVSKEKRYGYAKYGRIFNCTRVGKNSHSFVNLRCLEHRFQGLQGMRRKTNIFTELSRVDHYRRTTLCVKNLTYEYNLLCHNTIDYILSFIRSSILLHV